MWIFSSTLNSMDIRTVKGDPLLMTADAYTIYSQCMFQAEFEKYCSKIVELSARQEIYIFAAFHNGQIAGIITLEKTSVEAAEIIGIAVKKEFQRCGIGRAMVRFAVQELDVKYLAAETDEEAVGFYNRSSFSVTPFIRRFTDGEITRYNCVLDVLAHREKNLEQ